MAQNDIVKEFDNLPPEAQKQVIDFIAFLQTRYRTGDTKKAKQKGKLADEPFIGMWRDREDMRDSGAWVREVRTREWK
jgi:hypothetical protein